MSPQTTAAIIGAIVAVALFYRGAANQRKAARKAKASEWLEQIIQIAGALNAEICNAPHMGFWGIKLQPVAQEISALLAIPPPGIDAISMAKINNYALPFCEIASNPYEYAKETDKIKSLLDGLLAVAREIDRS